MKQFAIGIFICFSLFGQKPLVRHHSPADKAELQSKTSAWVAAQKAYIAAGKDLANTKTRLAGPDANALNGLPGPCVSGSQIVSIATVTPDAVVVHSIKRSCPIVPATKNPPK